jgi:hypothetical protein
MKLHLKTCDFYFYSKQIIKKKLNDEYNFKLSNFLIYLKNISDFKNNNNKCHKFLISFLRD